MIAAEPVSQDHKDKLYLVTRNNLSVGYQIAQTAHAVAEFIKQNPEAADRWYEISNSIICLEVEDGAALSALQEDAVRQGLSVTEFREPDLGDEITALAFSPSEKTRKFLSNVRCAGRRIHDQSKLHWREKNLREMSFAMMDCEQTKGQNVLQHGRSVREHYFALVDHLEGRVNLNEFSNWRIPEWVDTYREEILGSLPSRYVMDRYLTLHDCGKPSVRTVDGDGKVHFPNHAATSERVYRETFKDEADETVAFLIAHDMDAHLLKAADIPEFAKNPTAVAQILAALAEVTSNAAMFGGTDSTSFKIKYKQIDQRGKALMKYLFGEKGEK